MTITYSPIEVLFDKHPHQRHMSLLWTSISQHFLPVLYKRNTPNLLQDLSESTFHMIRIKYLSTVKLNTYLKMLKKQMP